MEVMGNVTAIKKFFESQPHGRQVTMQEMKDLSHEERNVLGDACRKELGAISPEDRPQMVGEVLVDPS